MRLIWILLALLVGASVAEAQVYKWTDENGTVHFSDKPPPANAKAKQLSAVTTQVAPELRGFCGRLRGLVPNMLGSARQGTSRTEILKRVGLDSNQMRAWGMTEGNLPRLVDAVFAYANDGLDHRATQRAVTDIHSRCMAGAYANVRSGGAEAGESDADGRRRGTASSGTGFLIAADLVATSFHVVEGGQSLTLHLSDGSVVLASLLSSDSGNDLAILRMATPTRLPALRVASDTIGLGADVFTIGFPQPELMGVEPKLATGVISATSGIQDDRRTYQISVPVQAGNSGGPLIDSEGRVVGIVASKLNAAKVFEWTGDLPQNVNYAVKSSHLHTLIPAETRDAATAVAGTSVQAKAGAVRNAVVRIEVR